MFRFLTKPVEPDVFTQALDAALRQHQLVTSERELLQNTLTGAVDVLTDVLAMASPVASRRTERTRNVVRAVAEMLGLDDDWRLPVAAMLSHLGCIAVPAHVMEKVERGDQLDATELQMWRNHPRTGAQLLSRIPRLDVVARWVGAQPMSQAAADAPAGAMADPEAGTGAEKTSPADPADVSAAVLSAVAAFLVHRDAGVAGRDVARRLEAAGRWPVAVVEAVMTAVSHQVPRGVLTEVTVRTLLPGMIIEDDVQTSTGMVLVRRGERVTEALIARLMNFAASVGVREPFRVLVDD